MPVSSATGGRPAVAAEAQDGGWSRGRWRAAAVENGERERTAGREAGGSLGEGGFGGGGVGARREGSGKCRRAREKI